MRRMRKILPLFVLFLVAACAPNVENLFNSPCSAPCWHGVTPGETSKDELLTLIPSLPYYREENVRWYNNDLQAFLDVPEVPDFNFGMTVVDDWAGVEIAVNDNIVSTIGIYSRLHFYQAHNDLGYDLEDVITDFGQPSGLLFNVGCGGDTVCLNVILVYSEQGVLAAVETANRDEIRITPRLPVVLMIYFAPSNLHSGLLALPNVNEKYCRFDTQMMPWPGYIKIKTHGLVCGK